jgi:hypothetical protein
MEGSGTHVGVVEGLAGRLLAPQAVRWRGFAALTSAVDVFRVEGQVPLVHAVEVPQLAVHGLRQRGG